MVNKIRQLSKHLIYILFSNIIYGLILYFMFTWLAGYSLLYAYLWNLALIIAGLAMDEYSHNLLQSKELVAQIKKDKDMQMDYRFIQWIMDSFVSFRTVLYLFYIIILAASQIIDSSPSLAGGNLAGFIHSNNYSILFLVALDMLIGQFAKDRERMKTISAKFKEHWEETQD